MTFGTVMADIRRESLTDLQMAAVIRDSEVHSAVHVGPEPAESLNGG